MPYLNTFAFELVLSLYPKYDTIHKDIYVKIRDFLLEEDLRNIRHKHLSKMVKLKGVVTRRSAVFSQLKKIFMECRCGNRIGPIFQNNYGNIDVGVCPVCQSNGPFAIDKEQTIYRNH